MADGGITVRGDSGFCRDALLNWCEAHQVDYLIGVAKNDRLTAQLAPAMVQAQAQCQASGQPARVFADFGYRTRRAGAGSGGSSARPSTCRPDRIRASW